MPRRCWLPLCVLTAFLLTPLVVGGPTLLGDPEVPARVDVLLNDNPEPTIFSLDPESLTSGGTAFSLTVQGVNFVRGATVRWNGADRGTAFVSDSQLRATIVATDIATAGIASVTVHNPPPGGGTSNAAIFTINNPVPSIHSLSPNSVLEGGSACTLSVRGGDFVATSVVRWDGQDRPTVFLSRNQLQAAIGVADIAAAGRISVTVFNSGPGGGISNAAAFDVKHARPEIQVIDPRSAPAGGEAFSLIIRGAGFASQTMVRWNGRDRETTFVNSTQLLAFVTAEDIAVPGTASVTVFTPAPGGGASNSAAFTIEYPRPGLARLEPPWATAGAVAFSLRVFGHDFYRGAVVHWNGSPRGTAFVNFMEVRATITLLDIASPGTAYVTVINPSPGGGSSNALPFLVYGREMYVFLPAVANEHLR